MKVIFSENIGKALYNKNITQNELARDSNLTRQTVNKAMGLSINEKEDISLETALAISRGLNVNFSDLFSRNFDPEKVLSYKKDDYLMIFTENVRRSIKNKNQKFLSTRPGIHESTISDILNGKVQNPKLSSLIIIATILEQDLGELFIRGDENNDF
ncbi:helix-turn-helix domain-containing protein [Carnobacterium divergens]|uniref:helix-turn-helix domain-containing protein n=1 Tax=Carnobacterium divergens TaxID=2748 RepID=UPI0014307163|nr:helix-turn-helix transcriptional regulator [Carnobacterium divergens]